MSQNYQVLRTKIVEFARAFTSQSELIKHSSMINTSTYDSAATQFNELAFNRPGNLSQNQLFVSGSYSKINVTDNLIIKTNSIAGLSQPLELHRELLSRKASVEVYYTRLNQIGVTMPETQIAIDTDENEPTLVITAKKIPAPNNFIQLPSASSSTQQSLLAGMLSELIKIINTHPTTTPIGYDSGFDNFISHNQKCYLIDIYPARLGYEVLADGSNKELPSPKLLVNYPEKEALNAVRQTAMRRFYYTPEGTLEHFTTWALGTVFAADPSCNWEKVKSSTTTADVLEVICDTLSSNQKSELIDHLEVYLNSVSGQHELEHRLHSNANRYAKSIKQWRATCHFF